MTNFETLIQILFTHPNVKCLQFSNETEEDFGIIEFYYDDEKIGSTISIKFTCDEPFELKIH